MEKPQPTAPNAWFARSPRRQRAPRWRRALAVATTAASIGAGLSAALAPAVSAQPPIVQPKAVSAGATGSWSALGTGIPFSANETVDALLLNDDTLYVGGSFLDAGGVGTADYVAAWDGASWSALGTGVDDSVWALATRDDTLYVGGGFIQAGGITVNRIAAWAEGTWTSLSGGLNREVYALAAGDDTVYAGGNFSTTPGNGVAAWSDSAWSQVDSGANATVRALAIMDDTLFMGGFFTEAGGVVVNYIAAWNGAVWSALGTGTNQSVQALVTTPDTLYAGGVFTSAGGTTANRIAAWDGTSWTGFGTGVDNTVFALAVDDTRGLVYVGGDFATAGGVDSGRIAVWDSGIDAWVPFIDDTGTPGVSNRISAVALDDSQVFVGGKFTNAGGIEAADIIARWTWGPPLMNPGLVAGVAGEEVTLTGERFIGLPESGAIRIGGRNAVYTRDDTATIRVTLPRGLPAGTHDVVIEAVGYDGTRAGQVTVTAPGPATPCSPGATQVGDDTQLQAAVANSVDDSIICVTAGIVVSRTLEVDDTTVTFEGAGPEAVLSGDFQRRIINATLAADDTLTVRDLVLDAGSATAGNGGALSVIGNNMAGWLVLDNVTVAYSNAQLRGGGLAARDLAHVAISDSTFEENSLSDASAGDVAGGGVSIAKVGVTSISGTTFAENTSVEWGGALFLNDSGVTSISDCTFTENTSLTQRGGAVEIDIDDSTLPGSVTITDTIFDRNLARETNGGALSIDDNDDTVSFTNVSFLGNRAGINAGQGSGGGVIIRDQTGPVVMTGITATNNRATSSGGFLRITDVSSTVTILDLDSRGNEALSDGGSIKQNGGELHVTDSRFEDDSAGVDGGSLFAYTDDSLSLTNVTARDTSAGDDGGFAFLEADDTTVATANFTLTDVTVTGGDAGGDDGGGGLYLRDFNSLDATRLVVTGSTAAGDGGGLAVERVNDVFVTSSTIADNSAGGRGGGVFIADAYELALITDSTFSGNSASAAGGGMWTRVAGTLPNVWIENSTVSGNSTVQGGGVFVDSTSSVTPFMFIIFATITGNSATDGGGIFINKTIQPQVDNSIISGNTATGQGSDIRSAAALDPLPFRPTFSLFTSETSLSGTQIPGPGNLLGEPLLNPLADNGGPTLTMLPRWDSPAVKTGDPNWVAHSANDQRGPGFPRDAGGRVNMGAIQGSSSPPDPGPGPVPLPVTDPPGPPVGVVGVAGDGSATVSWRAPRSAGSAPITNYEVVLSPGGQSCLVAVPTLTCEIGGLVNGTAYTASVRARNGAGWSAFSQKSAPFTPETSGQASIVISGTRGEVRGRPGVIVQGSTAGFGEGGVLRPWFRFPGQTSYARGRALILIDSKGTFAWERRTGRKIYVVVRSDDNTIRSNRITIASK